MTKIGIMIEGQEDLTWERWFRLAEAVEALGFESLFRSDHLVALQGDTTRGTLALWPSLTALALRTNRIRFGPMVSPMTFRHPAIVAKSAAAVSLLADSRLDLGLGAGWNAFEHQMYGLAYPRYGIRLEMLNEGATVIKALWSGETTSFAGKHYQLNDAVSYPLPSVPHPTIIMGGKGEQTLHIVAKHADEWNFTYESPANFLVKSRQLDAACEAIGRDPTGLRRSVMIPCAIGRDEQAVQERIDAHCRMFDPLPDNLADWRSAGFIGGTPDQVVEQLQAFVDAGVSRFMLQHNDLDDIDSLELLASDVLPYIQSAGKTGRSQPCTHTQRTYTT